MLLESRVDRRRLEFWLWAVIALGLFAYVWQGIGTHLLYYGFGVFTAYPVFSWDGSFLRAALAMPGGVAASSAALLAQTYRVPALGALGITAALAAVALGLGRLLPTMQADKLRDLAWAPAILALAIFNQYDDPLSILLRIGTSIWTAVLYRSIPLKAPAARVGTFLVLFSLTYHLVGATALLTACVVCLAEVLPDRRILLGLSQAVLACGVAYLLGRFLYGLGPLAIWTVGTPWDAAHTLESSALSAKLAAALYALVPGMILAASFFRLPAVRTSALQSRRRTKEAIQTSRGKADERLRLSLRLFAVAAAAIVCLAGTRSHIRFERTLHYWTCQRDWDRVIAVAHRMRGKHPFTPSGVFDINRALAHQGRLGEEMCAYPQDETRALFLSFENMVGRLQHAKLIELYLDLGCPNAAQKNAYELLDNEGATVPVLEAIVRIHLVKGEYESARVAFGVLQGQAGSGPFVHRWRDAIADPSHDEKNPQIAAWRRVRGTTDYAIAGISFETMLRRLLLENPQHRLAFEYLMAHYLLKHQRAEVIGGLSLLKPLGYTQLPRHYAEALLVHSLETKTAADPQGWSIPPEIYAEFRDITAIVKTARGNNQAAYDALAKRYGDTYTFYSMFNVSGVK